MYHASFSILYYDQQMHNYLTNYQLLQAPWGWHDSVETCRSVIMCDINVHLLVIVQNKEMETVLFHPHPMQWVYCDNSVSMWVPNQLYYSAIIVF